jgi:fructose-1,6-bisphosphatase/sedoheptulose 1,7-bisphosphatase-like protein
VPNEITVAVTGISGGALLEAVDFAGGRAETHSLVMSSRRRTVRRITTRHTLTA